MEENISGPPAQTTARAWSPTTSPRASHHSGDRSPNARRSTMRRRPTSRRPRISPIWQFTPRPGATDGDDAGDAQRDEGILDLDQERPRTARGLDPAPVRLAVAVAGVSHGGALADGVVRAKWRPRRPRRWTVPCAGWPGGSPPSDDRDSTVEAT
jgi:hypothetical protein